MLYCTFETVTQVLRFLFVCLGFMTYQPLLVDLRQIHFYTNKLLFQTIQFSISTQYQKHFYFKLFSLTKQF